MDRTHEITVRHKTTQDMVDVQEIARFVRDRTRSLDVLNAVGALLTYCRCLEHQAKLDQAAVVAALATTGRRESQCKTE